MRERKREHLTAKKKEIRYKDREKQMVKDEKRERERGRDKGSEVKRQNSQQEVLADNGIGNGHWPYVLHHDSCNNKLSLTPLSPWRRGCQSLCQRETVSLWSAGCLSICLSVCLSGYLLRATPHGQLVILHSGRLHLADLASYLSSSEPAPSPLFSE